MRLGHPPQPGRVDNGTPRVEDSVVQVEIGPVGGDSVLAWVSYARHVLDHVSRVPGIGLVPEDLARLGSLVDEWESTARPGQTFHWLARRETEEVEFLLKALLEVGNVTEAEHAAGRLDLRPPEADEFHLTLVRQMLAELAAEGPSCAQFAESLREQWGVAAQD